MTGEESIGLIRHALARVATKLDGPTLDRFAKVIHVHGAMHIAGRLAASRRGTDKAREELEAINRVIITLAERLAGLGPDALLALQTGGAKIQPMLKRLGDFNEEIKAAHGRLCNEDVAPRGGRPRDPAAAAIADYAARIYTKLTNEQPRRVGSSGGGFDGLLVAIFNAMNIEADTDYHIRRLTGKTRKN